MDTNFKIQCDVVALEAGLADINVTELAGRVLPGIVNGFTAVKEKLGFGGHALDLNWNESKLQSKLKDRSYVDLSVLVVFTPEGMTSTYMDYATALAAAVDYVDDVGKRIAAYRDYISQILTNRDFKHDKRSFTKQYLAMAAARQDIIDSMGVHFTKGNYAGESTYGKVLTRNADWTYVLKTMEGIHNKINRVDRRGLLNITQDTSELLGKVKEGFDKGALDNMSPEVMRNLADGAFQIASEVELFSVVYYRVQAMTEAINRTTDQLNKLTK